MEDLDCTFSEDLDKAITERDYEAVAYLLWAGVTPRLTTSDACNTMCKAPCTRGLQTTRTLR